MEALPLAVVCLALIAGAADAHATTITFGTNNGDYQNLGTSYTESGYRFVNDSSLARWPNGSTWDSDLTPSTGLHTGNPFTNTTITRVDGGAFDLFGIEFDDVFHQGSPSGALGYEYGFAGGGTSSGSLQIDNVAGFSNVIFNLAQLSYFSFKPSTELAYVQFDNVVVSAAGAVVPIPATLPLFVSALGALGWVARRRSKSARTFQRAV